MKWLALNDFIQQTSYSKAQIAQGVKSKQIEAKNIKGELYLRKVNIPDNDLFQESIAHILDMHSKLTLAKDETITHLKNENEFLKNTIMAMQETYLEEKKLIEFLRNELERNAQEIEALQKKYRLMWEKVGKK